VHWRQPAVPVGLAAAGDGEKFFLELARYRAGDPLADLDVVDGTDGRDFDGRADEKDFIHDVEHFAGDDCFLYGDTEIFGHFHHSVPGDTGQDARRERRSIEHTVVREENVHAGAFADVAIGVERDSFGIAIERRLHTNQLRVHVVGGRFGHCRKRVRSNARPGTNADIHTLGQRFWPEIRTRGPTGHVAFDRRVQRIDAHFAVTAQHHRLQVTGLQFAFAQ